MRNNQNNQTPASSDFEENRKLHTQNSKENNWKKAPNKPLATEDYCITSLRRGPSGLRLSGVISVFRGWFVTYMLRIAPLIYLIELVLGLSGAHAQSVDDGSDTIIGQAATRTIIALVERNLKSPDAKITVLRRSEGSIICGSVNVKNRDGLYSGERGFVIDLATGFFGRVPDGPEMMTFRPDEAYRAMEQVRQLYFAKCLD